WLALRDYRERNPEASLSTPVKRLAIFMASAGLGMLIVLFPYFLTLLKSPIDQTPIPHLSRANFLLQPKCGLHYGVMPFGIICAVCEAHSVAGAAAAWARFYVGHSADRSKHSRDRIGCSAIFHDTQNGR